MSGGSFGATFSVSSVSVFGFFGASATDRALYLNVTSVGSSGGGGGTVTGYALYRSFPATNLTFPTFSGRVFPRV